MRSLQLCQRDIQKPAGFHVAGCARRLLGGNVINIINKMNFKLILPFFSLLLFSCSSKDKEFSFLFEESIMEPTIQKNQKVIFSENWKQLQIGDIIAYDPPHVDGGVLIGRVAGLHGDVISYSEDWIVINESPYESTAIPYIKLYPDVPTVPNGPSELRIRPKSTLKINSNEVFIVADRWHGAIDSRYFGAIPLTRILGVAENIQ